LSMSLLININLVRCCGRKLAKSNTEVICDSNAQLNQHTIVEKLKQLAAEK
jgi:hypothetical protein